MPELQKPIDQPSVAGAWVVLLQIGWPIDASETAAAQANSEMPSRSQR